MLYNVKYDYENMVYRNIITSKKIPISQYLIFATSGWAIPFPWGSMCGVPAHLVICVLGQTQPTW